MKQVPQGRQVDTNSAADVDHVIPTVDSTVNVIKDSCVIEIECNWNVNVGVHFNAIIRDS